MVDDNQGRSRDYCSITAITTDFRRLAVIHINGPMRAAFPTSDLAVMRACAICGCQAQTPALPDGPR
jgi:hypothetical protein